MAASRRLVALAAFGFLSCALTGAGLYAQAMDDRTTVIVLALAQGGLYLAAAWLVWRNDLPRGALGVVLAIAVLMRLMTLLAPPYLSNDIHRYVWDGRVQGSGINPYRYVPVDEHLAFLRDDTVFPNINRNNYAHTIYPPVAEMIFFMVTRVSSGVGAMRTAMVGFDIVTILVLLRLLALRRQPRSRVLLYAWHPLTVWEIAGSGHIDAAAIAFVSLAFWAHARRHHALSGVTLGAAVLIKLYPAVLIPALWRPRDWRMPLALVLTALVAYAPYLGVGPRVFGFLPDYAAEEGLESGAGFYLWKLTTSGWQWATAAPRPPNLSVLPYLATAALVLASLALATYLRQREGRDMLGAAGALIFTFLVLLSPHYPWYFLLAITFFCFVPYPPMLYLTTASFLLYVPWGPRGATRFLAESAFPAESALYGPFAVLAVALWWRQHRRVRTGGMENDLTRTN